MNPLYVRIVCALLALVATGETGCRAIRRIGESRQSIAARRLSGQGFQAMHDGQWEIAETLFTDALDVSKSDDRANWGLAEAYWKRGERELAVEQMEQAVRLSADDPAFVQRLGRMYMETGRLEEANLHSESALESERDAPAAWALRGDCLKAAGQMEEALAAYHRALALQPDYPEVQLRAAEIYQSQQRYDRLLATLDRLQDGTGIDQAPARVDLLKGIAMRQLGRAEEAEQCFVRASTKDPDNARPKRPNQQQPQQYQRGTDNHVQQRHVNRSQMERSSRSRLGTQRRKYIRTPIDFKFLIRRGIAIDAGHHPIQVVVHILIAATEHARYDRIGTAGVQQAGNRRRVFIDSLVRPVARLIKQCPFVWQIHTQVNFLHGWIVRELG